MVDVTAAGFDDVLTVCPHKLDPANLLAAGKARLRPIVMSALIAILTLAPLALGLGRGSGLQKPLATAIVFGLAIGAPMVLAVLPMMVLVFSRQRGHNQPQEAQP